MKRKFKGGLTSVSLPVFIADTSSTTGGGLSGVTSASSGLVLEYRRHGQSTWTSVTAVSKTLGTFTSGGIVADGSLAGAYEVDFPDAAFASSARFVLCRIRGVSNMLPVLIEVELDAVDYQTDAFGALKPTTAGRTLDVSTGGEAGIDFANIGSPTTTVNLSGTTIKTATDNASQTSVDGKPTLAQIEASTVLAKDSTVAKETTVTNRPTLAQIEASTVLAKDSTVAKESTVTNRPTLAQIEASTVLAKETTVTNRPTLAQIEASTVLAKDSTVAKETTVTNRPTLAQIEASTVLAKDSTVAKETTVTNRPTLAQIEASTVLAKETTVAELTPYIRLIVGLF